MNMLVIGESLIDVIYDPETGKPGHFPGGSPLNVAVGLSRLGRETVLLTRIGDDEAGDTIVNHLTASNVSLMLGSINSEPTSMAYARVDDEGHASYEFDIRSSFPEPPHSDKNCVALLREAPRHVHIGSIGAHLMPGAKTVRRWIDFFKENATISYDPNVRIGLAGTAEEYRTQITEYLEIVDIFKSSIEDIELCFGAMDPKQRQNFVNMCFEKGVSLVILTEGAHGMNLFTRDHSIHVNALKVSVADTVGAGDATMAALIDGLARLSVIGREDVPRLRQLSGSMLTSLGTYAATAAAITVTRSGANPPTRREISAHSESYAVEGSIF